MKPHPAMAWVRISEEHNTGMKIGAAIGGAFGVFFTDLWIRGAIHEHWDLLRWPLLIPFLAMTVGVLFLLVYIMFFERVDNRPAAVPTVPLAEAPKPSAKRTAKVRRKGPPRT
jgi:MFS family permease